MRLKEKVALITGGGSGIGAASAKLFAKEGARVAVLGRTRGKLDEVVEEIRKDGGEAEAVEGDVSDYADLERAVGEVVKRWGRLDIVFANAGINGVWAPIDELKPDEESTEARDLEKAREPIEYPEGEIPLTDGKPGSAEQVAQLVLFLASDESSHITGTR